jgi:hypothetical protein
MAGKITRQEEVAEDKATFEDVLVVIRNHFVFVIEQ